jgi:hypothetical protein
MKKLLILFAFIPLLFGCTEDFFYYDQPSEPHLTGGKWTFVDYDIQVISAISPVEVIKSDTICIMAFGEQSYVTGGILMEQNYNMTARDRRFVIGQTQWDFDDNSFTLYVDGNYDVRYGVTFPMYMKKEHDQMTVENDDIGSRTTYSFDSNGMGAMPPTEFVLLSPEIVTDLYLSNGMRDKAVTIRVLLKFMR